MSIAIPLDPNNIEIIGFGRFLFARIKRIGNFHFVPFYEVNSSLQSPPQIEEDFTKVMQQKGKRGLPRLSISRVRRSTSSLGLGIEG